MIVQDSLLCSIRPETALDLGQWRISRCSLFYLVLHLDDEIRDRLCVLALEMKKPLLIKSQWLSNSLILIPPLAQTRPLLPVQENLLSWEFVVLWWVGLVLRVLRSSSVSHLSFREIKFVGSNLWFGGHSRFCKSSALLLLWWTTSSWLNWSGDVSLLLNRSEHLLRTLLLDRVLFSSLSWAEGVLVKRRRSKIITSLVRSGDVLALIAQTTSRGESWRRAGSWSWLCICRSSALNKAASLGRSILQSVGASHWMLSLLVASWSLTRHWVLFVACVNIPPGLSNR